MGEGRVRALRLLSLRGWPFLFKITEEGNPLFPISRAEAQRAQRLMKPFFLCDLCASARGILLRIVGHDLKIPPVDKSSNSPSLLRQRVARSLIAWFAKNARDLPWRRTHDPYAIWISEIMLQQTQVKTVIPYFDRWMGQLPTLAAFARARPQKVLKLWEGLGYYSRVRNAQAAAQSIMRQHGGRFPRNFEDILALPGIGRYTAGAISSIAFNQPTPILDGNVIRVLSRIFGVEGNPRDKETNAALWQLAGDLVSVDPARCSDLNQSLMELGALVCTPRQAQCSVCPARRFCFALREDRVAKLPAHPPRAPATERRFMAFVARRENRLLVRQRPGGAVNAHLWEFPNVEVLGRDKRDDRNGNDAPFRITERQPLCRIRHSITRYRILLEAYHARASSETPGVWKTIPQLKRLPFTSAHRKILNALGNATVPVAGRRVSRRPSL
jgi:A/G-specific adenine glycosylase